MYFAAKARSLFFFTTVNPVIETGGVMGESKINILKRIPGFALPKMFFVEKEKMPFSDILLQLKTIKLEYPIIAKPDIGERGFLVEKIKNEKQLSNYFKKIKTDFLIQEFIDKPLELSVLYYRMPDEKIGKITSVCIKKTLSVTGDGISSVEELMENYPRAKIQLDRFKKDFPEVLKKVLQKEEPIELEPIGNHSRGTTFLNGNHYIDYEMEAAFDKIGLQMKDIYYGRFDLKCDGIEKVKKGEGIRVLEFNGIASEPAHIYDPGYSIMQAFKDIFDHWKIIYKISKVQMGKGVKPMRLNEFYMAYKNYKAYLKMASL